MSNELKAHRIVGLDEQCASVDNDYYLKSEADMVIAELKDALRWREFSEEKPEHHQRILVCSRDYKTELRRWDEGCKFDVETQEIYTHWMPLPKEPEDFT